MAELLTPEEKEALSGVVAEIESQTAGELVVSVVGRSAEYAGRRIFFALGLTLLLSSLGALLAPTLAAEWILLVEPPLFMLFWWLSGCSPVLRRLVPSADLTGAVEARALQMFAARGVYRTRDRSGILLMISQAEHRAVILGDEGIHERVGSEGWGAHVGAIVQGIREKRACAAIEAELRSLGMLLAEHFPVRDDDTNELSDQVIREER